MSMRRLLRSVRAAGRRDASWLSALGFVLILAITIWRVTATYGVFNHTVDEPSHIASGTHFLRSGRVERDLTHSPLAQIAVALGPALLAKEGEPVCDTEREEQILMCDGARYWRTLEAARLGTLPFLVLMLATSWLWAARYGGPLAGLLAALLLANAPPVLAHAGLATTDAAAAATLSLALFLVVLWIERPTLPRALAVGAAAALALGTKLSALLYLPAASVTLTVVLLWRDRLPAADGLRRARQAAAALPVFLLVLWAVYGLTLHPLAGPDGLVADADRVSPVLHLRIFPLVELARGVATLAEMNRTGLPSYFMGEIGQTGWWSFFPIMFLVKTPLAFLALFAVGIAAAARVWPRQRGLLGAAAAAAAILAVAMSSRINLGLRHVLVIYPLASIVAGAGAAAMLEACARAAKAVVASLLAWLVIDAAAAHPDYIPYFNEAARREAAFFSADSDFAWGQDAKRLVDELSRRRIEGAFVAMNTTAKLGRLGPVETKDLWPGQPASGWIAAGVGRILNDRIRPPYLGLRWLACQHPVDRIGKTILLYHIVPGMPPRDPGDCGVASLMRRLDAAR